MATGMYGAVPEQLRELGTRLAQQIEAIQSIRAAVFTAMGTTTWEGPAREQFFQNWDSSWNPALTNMEQAFGLGALEITNKANNLELVMGAAAATG